MLNREATNTNFIVFGFTSSRFKPTIYRTQGEHANHYTTDAVEFLGLLRNKSNASYLFLLDSPINRIINNNYYFWLYKMYQNFNHTLSSIWSSDLSFWIAVFSFSISAIFFSVVFSDVSIEFLCFSAPWIEHKKIMKCYF